MKRQPISVIEAKIDKAIAKQKKYVEAFTGSLNPQVVAMRLQAEATILALEAIKDALNGDNVALDCLGYSWQ